MKPFNVQTRLRTWGVVLLPFPALMGCVNLTAPTEPIVITLNINIEVIARLVEDASEAVDENADIF